MSVRGTPSVKRLVELSISCLTATGLTSENEYAHSFSRTRKNMKGGTAFVFDIQEMVS